MNRHKLTRSVQPEFEQPACLHANMDLLKWAMKIFPFISSDIVLDCLRLAIECRVLDIRASPYDALSFVQTEDSGLRHFNLAPIRVDTEQGRQEYQQQQYVLWLQAAPLRSRLIDSFDRVLQCPQ
eukprot:c6317_g1_i1.p2 GENE.c6317_g1_i1~~c6317_g1_i1.p2  ORF type:complete len:125 (+),score=26.03 c6317_g1_i1:630-1004(+)